METPEVVDSPEEVWIEVVEVIEVAEDQGVNQEMTTIQDSLDLERNEYKLQLRINNFTTQLTGFWGLGFRV